MRLLNDTERAALELMVDRTSLRAVLVALRDIASDKADHINVNWQDVPLAAVWDSASVALANCAERRAVVAASVGG